ncbi:MAG: hypothetical protein QOI20_2227 [Acidimicrobiaceae bacterium]|nr:hypothetical protein [Acidimicrobiaceae bacterium]
MAIDTSELEPVPSVDPAQVGAVAESTGADTVSPTLPSDGGPADGTGAGAAAAAGTEAKPSNRIAVAVAFPVVACAVMTGGIFTGVAPRLYAAIAGLLGLGLAVACSRVKKPVLSVGLIVAGLFLIGLVMLLPNVGEIFRVQALTKTAAQQGNVLRPPVEFIAGWKPILGWLMAIVGFTAGWIALVVGWRAFSLLLPLPIAAFAGISVPDAAQVPSGIVVLVLFAIGLGLLSSEQAGGDDEDSRPSAAYEVRKALKALPLIAVIVAVLFVLAQTNFLFPKPIINPAQEPQKPKTTPLSEVEQRTLFEVESDITGPFRMGSLDVYDGKDWRLPPFADNQVKKVPGSGVVDPDMAGGVRATIYVAGLGGAVLPALPNTVGIIAKGPRLGYDRRNNNIRLVAGQVTPGLSYTVAAAALPSVEDLRAASTDLPKSVKEFTQIPDMPAEVKGLIDQAPQGSKWDQFDFLHRWILDNVTAAGPGTPVAITPDRVADMIAGEKKGSPFEIVAAQAMLARWIGLPSRIGYGFDGGEKVGNRLQVRPKDGAAFVEVYFPKYKWLPVIGTPRKAEPTVGNDPSLQRQDASVVPSKDIGVQLYLPIVIPPKSVLGQQIAVIVLLALAFIAFIALIYVLWPAAKKARIRSRRRRAAMAAGTRARVALAYAEWRDYATDLGFAYPTETPLMFLDRFLIDDEHTELAWLVTRVLWGDLQGTTDPLVATIAEELSRSLRRRLGAAQPGTVRAVAAVSRLSVKHPYAPDTDLTSSRRQRARARKERSRVAVPA